MEQRTARTSLADGDGGASRAHPPLQATGGSH